MDVRQNHLNATWHGLHELAGLEGETSRPHDIALGDGAIELTREDLREAMAVRGEMLAREVSDPLVELAPGRCVDTLVTLLAALGRRIPFEAKQLEGGASWKVRKEWRAAHISSGSDAAYVMSTSGSSGAAKRTLVTRTGLRTVFTALRSVWAGLIPERAVWTQAHPLTFGYSMCEILGCIAFQGTLRIVPRETPLSLTGITELTRLKRLVVACLTPSELNTYCRSHPDALPSVIILSGEPAHRVSHDAVQLLSQPNGPTVINTYAATETSGQITSHTIHPSDWERARSGFAGRALPGIQVSLVADDGSSIPPEDLCSTGEIVVGGDAVAAGYLHDSAAHRNAFTSYPAQTYRTGDYGRWAGGGGLFVIGRNSRKVKLAGQWLDLDEAERAVTGVLGILDAVTFLDETASETGSTHTALGVACVQSDPSALARAREAVSHLTIAPIPVRMYLLDSIPRLGNGKLDLRVIRSRTVEPETPSPAEQILHAWRRVLGDGVDLQTNVFSVGLDSLGISFFVEELRTLTGLSVPIRLVFDHPVVQDQVAALQSEAHDKGSNPNPKRSTRSRQIAALRIAARRR